MRHEVARVVLVGTIDAHNERVSLMGIEAHKLDGVGGARLVLAMAHGNLALPASGLAGNEHDGTGVKAQRVCDGVGDLNPASLPKTRGNRNV